jgi:hypothetical protein
MEADDPKEPQIERGKKRKFQKKKKILLTMKKT